MKVIVYAISKNEEQNINKWINSMKEADDIYVLDTGSTDNTVKLLKNKGVHVEQKIINPWRFDKARNYSLNLVPKDVDICVCTDLDEVFNKGWRKELEQIWKENTNRCRYIYNWSLDKNNIPKTTFYYEKIHDRNNYKWIYPVHEVLFTTKNENYITTNNIILNHYPDNKKSRKNYLKLLKLSIKENPLNDRNMHYLGREYMYNKEYNKSIKTLKKHLNLKTSTWKNERSASMRFISRCYLNLNKLKLAKIWLNKAINETPYLRDPLVEMAILEYKNNNWKKVIKYCNNALNIKLYEKTYINEIFSWDHTIYDLLSIAYYNTNNYSKSKENIDIALSYLPNDSRLLTNKKIIEEKFQ